MKNSTYCVISTTINSQAQANTIAQALLEAHLVACVQKYKIQSQYHWQNTIACDDEILLQMKTKSIHFEAIKQQIETLHHYDVPEIIMTTIVDANEAYLSWIDTEVK